MSKYQNQSPCKYYEISNFEPVQVLAITKTSFVLLFTNRLHGVSCNFYCWVPIQEKTKCINRLVCPSAS